MTRLLPRHVARPPASSTMVQPNNPRCRGSYACSCRSNPVREAKTGVREKGSDGLALHSVGGVCFGDRGRPRRVLQSRTVGPISISSAETALWLTVPRKKYGDVFAVKAFGRVVTYVVSPSVCPDSWNSRYGFTQAALPFV